MTDAKKGSPVLFHFDSGGKRFVRNAIVLYVWRENEVDADLEMLCLEVDFQPEDFETGLPARLQAHVPRGWVPEGSREVPSGTWTYER